MEIRHLDSNRQQILIRLCISRWSERYLVYGYFYLALWFIVETLEIANGTQAEMGSFEKKYTEGWGYKTKREATSLLNAVSSFEFIISLIGLHRLLHPLAGITCCLQGHSVNIAEAYDDTLGVMKDIKTTRKNVNKEFSVILVQAERVAAKVGTQSSTLHITKKAS